MTHARTVASVFSKVQREHVRIAAVDTTTAAIRSARSRVQQNKSVTPTRRVTCSARTGDTSGREGGNGAGDGDRTVVGAPRWTVAVAQARQTDMREGPSKACRRLRTFFVGFRRGPSLID